MNRRNLKSNPRLTDESHGKYYPKYAFDSPVSWKSCISKKIITNTPIMSSPIRNLYGVDYDDCTIEQSDKNQIQMKSDSDGISLSCRTMKYFLGTAQYYVPAIIAVFAVFSVLFVLFKENLCMYQDENQNNVRVDLSESIEEKNCTTLIRAYFQHNQKQVAIQRKGIKGMSTKIKKLASEVVFTRKKLHSLQETLDSEVMKSKNFNLMDMKRVVVKTVTEELLEKILMHKEKESEQLLSRIYKKVAADKEDIQNQIRNEFKLSFNILKGNIEKNVNKKFKILSGELEKAIKKQVSDSSQAVPQDIFKQTDTLIKTSLSLYAADRTGMADYALIDTGGSVHQSNFSPVITHNLKLFGFNILRVISSPEKMIQASMDLGDCWAFKGSAAQITLKLAMPIFIQSFSVEHVPKKFNPMQQINSAPKEFTVFGMDDKGAQLKHMFGIYRYDKEKDPLQIFEPEVPCEEKVTFIEINFHSNWGNLDFTCVYRFRVHGAVNL